MTDDIQIAYYGDDFTGSTDVMEALSLAGVSTVLFLERPAATDLEAFGDVDAVGIAGTSRDMTPAEMDEALPPAFGALAEFDPELVQYKVCSTFDSAPDIGSIGHAIDLAQARFESPFVPVVVAAPSLEPRGRYVVFGNLFATVDDETYRLDRHPTMADHPVTPMGEADLTRHLGEQTDRRIRNLDVRHAESGKTAVKETLTETINEDEIVVFDGLTHDHQRAVGGAIWESRPDDRPLFSASSSGLNYALTAHWRETGQIADVDPPEPLEPVERLVVVSGSASPVNDAQIEWAIENGFRGIRLDTAGLIDSETVAAARADAIETALEALDAGESVLLYTARGDDDSAIERTNDRAAELGIGDEEIGRRLGRQQGRILRELLDETELDRVCVAGGDTSGYVAPELDVYALEFASSVGAGSPLCRARSRTDRFDGLEIALKGGQVETSHDEPDYFGVVRSGGAVLQ